MKKKQGSKLPSFQFYPQDFISDMNVQLMSNQAKGCYIHLLCLCWIEGSLPDDLQKLARLCNEPIEIMTGIWEEIKPCFKSLGDGTLVNPRLQKESLLYGTFIAEKQKAGKLGAAKRWNKLDKNGTPNEVPLAKNAPSPSPSNIDIFTKVNISENEPEKEEEKSAPIGANPDGFVSEKLDDKQHFSKLVGSFLPRIESAAKRIDQKCKGSGKSFNPYQFIQKKTNERFHPEIILSGLTAIDTYFEQISGDPYAYVSKLMKRGQIDKETQGFKSVSYEDLAPDVAEMLKNIFKSKEVPKAEEESVEKRKAILRQQKEQLSKLGNMFDFPK